MISDFILSKVTRKDLLYDKSLINGEWIESNETFPVLNPANGKQIASVSSINIKNVKKSIEIAKLAFTKWKTVLPKKRADLLRKWYDLIIENKEDLAIIITAEEGKPLIDAKAEIEYAASFVEWFAEEAKRIHGDVFPVNKPNVRYLGIKEPIGVVAAITPWNFPSAMITRKVAPALAAGCSIVLKPAEETPLSALALAYLAIEAGFPKGVLNVITGDPKMIGKELCDNKDIRKISFTGSTEVGKHLYRESAGTLKKLSLELGGNSPFIVFDDADIELAAEGLIRLKERNTGQSCTCANRVFVHENIYNTFVDLIKSKYGKLIVNDGFANNSQQGPLINQAAVDKVTRLVEEAVAKGGKILYQSKVPEGKCYYPTTIIELPNTDVDIFHEEIFGPVIALYKFSSDEELLIQANDTDYGLAAYFYTNNKSRVWNIAEQLEYGMVGINESRISNEVIPFGGIKNSGFGREGSKYGIEEFMYLKYYSMGDI